MPASGRWRSRRRTGASAIAAAWRALTGDMADVIADFEFAVKWAEQGNASEDLIAARKAWIVALKAGENPFDEERLLKLRGG